MWLFPLRSSGSSAHSLKEQKNLNSFFAVMFGLSNSAISRLAHTWEVGAMWRAPRPSWGCWLGMGRPSQSSDSSIRLCFTAAAPQSPEALFGPREVAGECWALALLPETLILGLPAAPPSVSGHFQGFQSWARVGVPLGCVLGALVRNGVLAVRGGVHSVLYPVWWGWGALAVAVRSCVKTRTGHMWCRALGSEAPGEHRGTTGLQPTPLRPRKQARAPDPTARRPVSGPQEVLEGAGGGHKMREKRRSWLPLPDPCQELLGLRVLRVFRRELAQKCFFSLALSS